MHTEQEIRKLTEDRDIRSAEKPLDFAVVKQYLKYFLQHMEELLCKTDRSGAKSQLFRPVIQRRAKLRRHTFCKQNFGGTTEVKRAIQAQK